MPRPRNFGRNVAQAILADEAHDLMRAAAAAVLEGMSYELRELDLDGLAKVRAELVVHAQSAMTDVLHRTLDGLEATDA